MASLAPAVGVAGWVAAIAGVVALVVYRRQVVSRLTHWRGPPAHTRVYVPFDVPPDVHLAVAGDTGHPGRRLAATATAMGRVHADVPYRALLLLGDLAYPSGDPAMLDRTVRRPFAPLLDDGVELLAILGNHDVRRGNGPAQVTALGLPGRWWSVRYGDVLVVGVDSNDARNDEQLAWLERTLADPDARWRIVALHHPPYSEGYQGASRQAREIFSPIFERTGVQLVLSGHEHDYQRMLPVNGVTYVVSGGGSHSRRTGAGPLTAASFGARHFLDIGITADRLLLRAVMADGRVGDECALQTRVTGRTAR